LEQKWLVRVILKGPPQHTPLTQVFLRLMFRSYGLDRAKDGII
jgi:hypothetical protein